MKLMLDFVCAGGAVMWLIVTVSFLAWWLALVYWQRVKQMIRDLKAVTVYLDRIRGRYDGRSALESSRYELELKRYVRRLFVADEFARITQQIGIFKSFVTLLPLLGLLGTIMGMLYTFEVIRGHGVGDPKLLAGGIREALITTQAGLIAALPLLFIHRSLSTDIDRARGDYDLVLYKLESVQSVSVDSKYQTHFGQIATALGFVDHTCVKECLQIQGQHCHNKPYRKIGDILLANSGLSMFQFKIIQVLQEGVRL